jgi:hypothetical protein
MCDSKEDAAVKQTVCLVLRQFLKGGGGKPLLKISPERRLSDYHCAQRKN